MNPLRSPDARQTGFGLVELLVALAVTGLLVTGILEIFLGTRQSYRLVSAQSHVQENGRFATAFLHRDLRLAGFPRNDGFLETRGIYTVGGLTADDFGGAGGGNNSDTFTVMYQTDPTNLTPAPEPTVDCMGNSTDYDGNALPDYAGGFYAKNRYLILPTGGLACIPYNVSDTPQFQGNCTLTALNANPIVVSDCEEHILVDSIDNMQVLYGVDTDLNPSAPTDPAPFDGVANLYQNAAQVTTAGTWGKVVSMRIELLVNSGDNDGLDTDDTATTYSLLDAPPLGPFGDRLIRSVFSTTVILRNRIP